MSIDPTGVAALLHTPAAMAQGRFNSGTRQCGPVRRGTVRSGGENSGRAYYRNQNQIPIMTVIKLYDPWGNERHSLIAGDPGSKLEEEAIAEAREWAWEGCRIELWSVHQYCPNQKMKEIPLSEGAK